MSKPRMILVVDDDPQLLTFFKDYFKQEGYNAMLLEDPAKAIRIANLVHPDLLILDIKMPKIDGFDVLAKVRESTPEIKTIILSGVIEGEIEKKIKGIRVQAVLKKPVSFEELERHILKLLNVTKKEIQEKIPVGERPEVHVLFVDDEEEIVDFFREALSEYGFITDVVRSGEDGLRLAKEKHYDVLITDNSMADMSGYDMVKILTASDNHKPYAIAVYSANLVHELMEQYRNLGVTKFFHKPSTFQEIIDWLESQIPLVAKKRQARPIKKEGDGRREAI